jgi:hypothetical protein
MVWATLKQMCNVVFMGKHVEFMGKYVLMVTNFFQQSSISCIVCGAQRWL